RTRLGGHRRVSANHPDSWFVFPAKVGAEHRGLFCIRAPSQLVAGGHLHGGHHVCRGHPAGRQWTRLHPGRGRELAVVEFSAFRHDDRFSVRAVVAALRRDHRKPAAFLRGFRAVYLGLLMNCLILGWVTKAMVNIISTSLGISDARALAICVFFLMPFTGIYVSLGGLWGVLWTDLFQFVLKMAIVIAVAWYGVHAVGGMPQLLEKLAAKRNLV